MGNDRLAVLAGEETRKHRDIGGFGNVARGFAHRRDRANGFTLHDELALLVESGLTPLEALQTATLNPAKVLGKTADLGTIEPGKLADLVLLRADPLADIHNTQRITAVVVNGKLLGRPELDALLREGEELAKKN